MSSKYGFDTRDTKDEKKAECEMSLRNEADRIDAIVRDILSDFLRANNTAHDGDIVYYFYPMAPTWKVYHDRETANISIRVALCVNNELSVEYNGFDTNSIIQLQNVLEKYTGHKTSYRILVSD